MTRRALVILAAVATALAAALPAQAAATWAHWEGTYFSCFVSTNRWQVVENANGVDVSSPVGDAIVSFAYTDNAPSIPTLAQVANYAVGGAGIGDGRVVRVGAVRGQQQDVEFVGHRGGVLWHGVVTAGVDAYGFHAYLRMSAASRWKQVAPTLLFVRNHISFMHG